MTTTKTQPKGWKETTLGNLITGGEYEIRNNLRLPLSSEQRLQMQGQYPYYGAAGAIDSINDYRVEGFHLLIAEDGTITSDGKSPMLQLVDGKFWVSNHAHIIRGKNEQSTRRLYYFLRNVNINPYITGAVQPKLSKDNLFRVSFLYPESELEKQEVTAVLASLDDKIELLRKQNETLEAIARAIFHEWFVEFNFPNEEGKPYKASGGKMIDSELGEIPEGWRVEGFSDGVDFLNGLALQKYPPKSKDDELPVIKIRELKAGITEETDKASKGIPEKYIVQNGDLLFSWSGSLEVVFWKHGQGALNQHLFKVTSDKYPKWFLYLWLFHHLPFFRSIAANKATTMGHIQRLHLEQAKVLIPTDDTFKKMDSAISPLLEKVMFNNSTIKPLSITRDTLLPKLMGGEVRAKL